MATDTFASLGLNANIVKGLGDKGFDKPTAVQKYAIPSITSRGDSIIQTPSENEANAIIAIAALQKVDANTKATQVLVLSGSYGKSMDIEKFTADVAGSSSGVSTAVLKMGIRDNMSILESKPQILVAQVRRVRDCVSQGKFDTSDIKSVIVERADTLAAQEAIDPTHEAIGATPSNRQVIILAGELNDSVRRVADRWASSPDNINKDGSTSS